MYEAGLAFVAKTEDAVDILKWYVLCALDENCMAPNGSQGYCYFGNDSYGRYGDCHRYDQSVINVLLANANYFDRTYYASEIVDFFKIKRGGAKQFYPPKYDSNCTS
ncbi:hypothetical protein WR25_10435 [Diploscapter pachys]|uniref:Uncharacterized protein n=1 Tax=Diploscapter pachys TaxID=2018661 RepID=A0A2A2JMA5_9BILA|nr:hypothetical protein WR25_10435 [Diploscapter pachys]